jgi:membrane protein insertase Oxa1/YidC/SpoIIIJ
MLEALKFFFALSGNWGLAIILLTVAAKVALYPLTSQTSFRRKPWCYIRTRA